MNEKTERIAIKDMTCLSCEQRIEKALLTLPGVAAAAASYPDNNVQVTYDAERLSREDVIAAIEAAGYTIGSAQQKTALVFKMLGVATIFFAIFLLGEYTNSFDMSAKLQGQVTYAALFFIGVFTSLHCVGMCGGIMLSQSVKEEPEKGGAFLTAITYNIGRVLGYTVLGGIVGAIGSVLSVSIGFMAAMAMIAGVFMVLMGLNMAGVNIFRKYLKLPTLRSRLFKKADTPFLVGLLNGLMPCGPLQTMQLYALATGSALSGALSMLIFALGTLPLMLSFGAISGWLAKGATKRLMKLSGVFIIVLGIVMTNRGLALAGVDTSLLDIMTSTNNKAGMVAKAEMQDGYQIIKMTADDRGYTPNVLYVQKGVPVKWIIDGAQINSCNNQIIVPALNIKKKLAAGETVIEFTPQEQDLNFSCWMGMIKGLIRVVDDVNAVDISKENISIPKSSGCCGDGGANSSCCSSEGTESIYNSDITQEPTARIIKKASVTGNTASVTFTGKGVEFEPLIVIINKNMPTRINFDLTGFDRVEGTWEIVDYQQKQVVKKFMFTQKNYEFTFDQPAVGTYVIYQDRSFKGIIEVVDDLAKADPEKIREKLFKNK